MLLVRLGAVFVNRRLAVGLLAARVRSDAAALVEDLERADSQANFHPFTDELIRDRVVMALDFDVVVDVDARRLPLAELIALDGQRLQGRAVERLIQAQPRVGALAEGSPVDPLEQSGDRLIELAERGEAPLA